MDNQVKVITMELAKEYDDFIFSCLEPFGITMENAIEFKDRILIVEASCFNVGQKSFYLDNVHIFDVMVTDGGLEIKNGTFLKKMQLTQIIDRKNNTQYNERVEK